MKDIIKILAKTFGKERYAKVIICLVLLSFGISKSEINKKLGTSYPTLRKYKSSLDAGTIGELFEFSGKRTKSELDKYEAVILKDFEKNPPKTLREAQTRIEQLTQLKRSLNRIRVWLKKRGFALAQ
jgi:transposase